MRRLPLAKAAKILLFAAGGFAVAYVGSSLLVSWLLVRPKKGRNYDCIPQVRHGELEPVILITADGLRLHAWVQLCPNANPNDWVLLLHGYRSDRMVLHNRRRFFARRGYNTLLLHFRGHGSSDPALISYGYHERKDVEAAFDFIHSLRPNEHVRIGIDGISMGAAAAAYAVAHGEVDPHWMILESCYDNIHHALTNRLAQHIGESLTQWFTWPIEHVVEHLAQLRTEDLDPAKALEKARCPILVMAGDSERVLKTVEIEYLYGCIPEPKRLVLFPGATHEDLLAFNPGRYIKAVRGFLKDLVPKESCLQTALPVRETHGVGIGGRQGKQTPMKHHSFNT